jgi:hypothetical protein
MPNLENIIKPGAGIALLLVIVLREETKLVRYSFKQILDLFPFELAVVELGIEAIL